MQLQHLIQNISATILKGSVDIAIDAIAFDSRTSNKNTLYIAQKGTITDGHLYIDKAIENGAVAVIVEQLPQLMNPNCTYLMVESTTLALGIVASEFYQNPSRNIAVVGITGTNGKTTVTTLLHQLAIKLGYTAGLISTVENRIGNTITPATHTTPDAINLQKLFVSMLDSKCQYCFMEVSSHALEQGRVNGVSFVGAGFTNISHDHLDYHITFDAYIKAKKKLFDTLPNQAFAISNKDDKRGAVMLQNSTAKKIMYGLHSNADYTLRIVENTFEGMELKIENDELHTFLIGEFNAYNLLLVYAIAIELGWDKNAVLAGISTLQPARGRFEYVKSNSGTVAIVDYAHTPDALQKIITSINQIRTRNEKLITIIGCGGDRDKLKRPEMGRIASLNSDKIILTSDNPRSENPTQIIEQMYEGIELGLRRKVTLIEDRKQAIHAACSMANAGDIILIAGKGHETYQEINGIKHPMNDLQIVTERLI